METLPDRRVEAQEETAVADPWVTIVWNDPVNLMSYVTYVFESYFGHPREKAEKLMKQVHEQGRAVVSTGSLEAMEVDVQAMHELRPLGDAAAKRAVMRGFRRRRGMYVARLDDDERGVIAALVADVAELLGAGRIDEVPLAATVPGDGSPRLSLEPVVPPIDPAVRRLLPDASRDDPEVSAEFRRLTEGDIRAGKVARLGRLWTALTTPADGQRADAFAITPDDAKDVAAALTDLRLVLAERLQIRTDGQAERLYDTLLTSPTADLDDVASDDLDPATRRYLVAVYGALSWLQESLVEALLVDLRKGGGSSGGGRNTPTGQPPTGERPASD